MKAPARRIWPLAPLGPACKQERTLAMRFHWFQMPHISHEDLINIPATSPPCINTTISSAADLLRQRIDGRVGQ